MRLAADAGGVAVAVDEALYYLEADSGRLAWTSRVSPCFSPELYLTAQAVHVWCFSEKQWRVDRASGAVLTKAVVGEDTSYAAPQFADGRLYDLRTEWQPNYRYHTADRRYLEARDPQTYAVLWAQPLPLAGDCRLVVAQGDVYYTCAGALGRLSGASGSPVWQTQVDSGAVLSSTITGPWVFYQGDVVYAFGNQVRRVNGTTGAVLWQTALRSETLVTVMAVGERLLVGTTTGYLHLLEAGTGALAWEQDVWASVEPRNVYIRPIGVTSQTVIIAAQDQLLSLVFAGATQPPSATPASQLSPTAQQTARPTATASQPPTAWPTASATHYPVFTPPPPDVLPPLPEDRLAGPAVLAAFLNATPGNSDRLAELLESWEAAGQGQLGLQTVDFDGDGQSEWIVTLGTGFGEGWLAVIRQSQGHAEVAWLDASGRPGLDFMGDPAPEASGYVIADLNGDRRTDLVYAMTTFGACSAYGWVTPLSWNGTAFVSLDPRGLIALNDLTSLKVEPQPGSPNQQIVIEGGWSGCGSLQAQLYGKTNTYRLRLGGYALEASVPSPRRNHYFYLLEASDKLLAGDDAGVIALLEESLASPEPGYRTEIGMAFAEYQLTLANIRLGNEQAAAYWAETGHFSAQMYSQIKLEFWQAYSQNHDWTAAAEVARLRARLAGPARMQPWPIDWAGFPGYITLEEIAPCSACLQGPLAHWDIFGP